MLDLDRLFSGQPISGDHDLLRSCGDSVLAGSESALVSNGNVHVFLNESACGKSYRFLAHNGARYVSCVQVVDNGRIVIANAFTAQSERRKGFAAKCLAFARDYLGDVHHSPDLSEDGQAFALATQ